MNASALIGKPVTHSAGQYIYNKIFKKITLILFTLV